MAYEKSFKMSKGKISYVHSIKSYLSFQMSDVHDDDGMHSRWEHDYILDSADEIVTGKLCGGGVIFYNAVYKRG